MNQKLEFRIMMGYMAGILCGTAGAGIVILFSNMLLWIKIFSVIGLFSASLGTLWGLIGTIRQYKTFIEMTKPKAEDPMSWNIGNKPKEEQNASGNTIKNKD